MELVSFAKEMLQDVAEQAASYRIGQTVLRQLDRALWVVEKCARWAVPPPLDQDERPQPELIRPLPWVFFLIMLVTLRITRESISLINLVMGKPPLRSADVVMYIQSKRRYLRTLKYTGNRAMRARSVTAQPPQNWYTKLQSLFEVTMCFRGRDSTYGNNNTSTNNEELLVVKRSKRSREPTSPVATTSETSMERLIEKMMVDLDADSDEDSSFTLTSVTSPRSDRSDSADSDQDTVYQKDNSSGNSNNTMTPPKLSNESSPKMEDASDASPTKEANMELSPNKDITSSTPQKLLNSDDNVKESKEDKALTPLDEQQLSPKNVTQMLIQNEKCSPPRIQTSPKNDHKIANGRPKNAPSKKRGSHNERRDADASVTKKADRSF